MKNIFNTIQLTKPKRNHFDMSHDRKFSMDMGTLTPILCQEVIPGDKFNLQTTQMIRFAPMVSPAMHKIDVYTHFFFVPNRIIWDGWEKFITGGQVGDVLPVFPTITIGDNQLGTILDYLGVPTSTGYTDLEFETPIQLSALPLAAYAKIYDEYYLDQNLQTPLGIELTDGETNLQAFIDAGLMGKPLNRAWEHDYFTSSLPFAQKGDTAILPLGSDAPLEYIPTEQTYLKNLDGTTHVTANILESTTFGTIAPATQGDVNVDNSANLSVDLSQASSATINDLRRAFRLQEWLEKNARGGTRYIETILSHFGVQSKDSRLQRPEYLGGGKSPVSISEVLQTSGSLPEELVSTPQGNLSGHGINVGQSHSFSQYFTEHGFIIGIMSVMPKPAYQQGLQRFFTKFDKLQYYWPSFANIGEQEVLNKEIFAGTPADEQTFGYVPRYAEYRYTPSTVHGDFKETLAYWHLGRQFLTPPALNEDFIKCVPSDRIFAVQNLPDDGDGGVSVRNFHKLYCQVSHRMSAVRPIPKYGIPTF